MENELVTITKAGEPQKLTILLVHLEEHQKLGWRECDPDPVDNMGDGEFIIETATAAQLRAYLTKNGVEFKKNDSATVLRELCSTIATKV